MGKITPSYFQVGKGGPPTLDMWKRSVNKLRTRNIFVNTLAKDMSSVQWKAIPDLTNDGVEIEEAYSQMPPGIILIYSAKGGSGV